jgi:transitional endoplasmic reticulum ATPase
MSNEMIKSLLEALQVSPDNIPLRIHIAELLVKEQNLPDAIKQFQEVLNRSYGNNRARMGLAHCYFEIGKFSTAIIIYEELQHQLQQEDTIRYIKCLIKENSLQLAAELYQKVIAINPGFRDEEIDGWLRMPSVADAEHGADESYSTDDKYFMEKPKWKFSDVGGMHRIKEEISLKIIQPLRNPELYKAFGKKAGGGIMLYGPPGCGKTFLAKATAGEINARFISIGLHDILEMWIGNSEKNLHEIFELARRNKPCVLFFDEVDAIGASRSDLKQSAMRHVINQFLAEMDGVSTDNEGILILAATNAPWSVDPAFRRPGRFDRIFFVEPPDESARQEILQSLLRDKPVADLDFRKIASSTDGYSGADLKAIVDIAIEEKLKESMSIGSIQPINSKDLLRSLKEHRPSTQEWFSSARNYALYANDSGIYDEILRYLKIKK